MSEITANPDASRKEFEAWAQTSRLANTIEWLDDNNCYSKLPVQSAWEAWQAARSDKGEAVGEVASISKGEVNWNGNRVPPLGTKLFTAPQQAIPAEPKFNLLFHPPQLNFDTSRLERVAKEILPLAAQKDCLSVTRDELYWLLQQANNAAAPTAPSGNATLKRAAELLEQSAAPFDEACTLLRLMLTQDKPT
jgi:hypothetical protein